MVQSQGFGSPISIIVSTYNRPDALDAVLRGLSKQSDQNFEVVIADDGSGPETEHIVGEWRARWRGRLSHTWHPDAGFRLAEVRNRAVAAASGDYLIFLDGDCIPRKDFIASHRRLAEPGWMVCGHRLMLSEPFTRKVVRGRLPIEDWTFAEWMGELRRGSIDRLTPLLRLPGAMWRRHLLWERTRKVRGCNMAVWRSNFLEVDGFDATFVGWGHEDYDLAARLQMIGVSLKDGRYATGVLHLWHPPADRTHESAHWDRISATVAAKRFLAHCGVSALKS